MLGGNTTEARIPKMPAVFTTPQPSQIVQQLAWWLACWHILSIWKESIEDWTFSISCSYYADAAYRSNFFLYCQPEGIAHSSRAIVAYTIPLFVINCLSFQTQQNK